MIALSDCEDFFIGTINTKKSNPSNNGYMSFENTNSQNCFIESLSDNSNNQVFHDCLNVTNMKNIISVQHATHYLNNINCFNISRDKLVLKRAGNLNKNALTKLF